MRSPHWRWTAAGLCATLCVGCLVVLFGGTREVDYHFFWTVGFAALIILGGRGLALENRRERCCFAVLGMLIGGAQVLGLRLELAGYTGVRGLLLCLGAGVGAGPAVGYVLAAAWHGLCHLRLSEKKTYLNEHWVAWGCAALIFLGWLPVFLAYWPGISAYDIYTQLDEIFSGQYTNRNPLLHTLLLGAFYRLGQGMGSPAWGYALFIMMQMAVMAAAYGAAMGYLWRIGVPRALFFAALVLFALLPVHAMLAISDTKDGFFVAFLTLLLIRFHRLLRDPDLMRRPGFVAGFVALGTLMCMMRNNGFVGILAGLLAGLLAMERGRRLRLCVLMLGTLGMYMCALGGLKAVCDASGSLATELVSVQSQQMGRVYAYYHESEPDDCYEIRTWLPTVEDYTPYTADPLKTFAIVNRPDRMWGFLKLWGRVGLKHPVTYLDAWLLTTKGYWYLDDTTHARIYGEGEGTGLGYLLTNQVEPHGLASPGVLPGLRKWYERLFTANDYQRLPVLSLLFAPALWVWLAGFLVAAALIGRDRCTLGMLAMVIGCFLPLLCGACVLIRYAYPFVACVPLMLGSALAHQREKIG